MFEGLFTYDNVNKLWILLRFGFLKTLIMKNTFLNIKFH